MISKKPDHPFIQNHGKLQGIIDDFRKNKINVSVPSLTKCYELMGFITKQQSNGVYVVRGQQIGGSDFKATFHHPKSKHVDPGAVRRAIKAFNDMEELRKELKEGVDAL